MRLLVIVAVVMMTHVSPVPLCARDYGFITDDTSPGPALTFTNELNRLTDLYATLAEDEISEDCVVLTVDLAGVGIVTFDLNATRLRGGDALVFPSSDPINQYVVRVTQSASTIEQTAREKAFRVIAGTLNGGTLATHTIREGSMSQVCVLRTMVSDHGGSLTLFDFSIKVNMRTERMRTAVTQPQIAAMAVRIIELVRDVHSLGMVHGDIHRRNFLVSDPGNLYQTLRMIDFGRSRPYIDPFTGRHICNDIRLPDWTGGVLFLSPFELEGSLISRRDDMYRVSEMLYYILGGFKDITERPAEAAIQKRAWHIHHVFHPVFNEFHDAMCQLAFEEQPDYDKWIDRFLSVAMHTS